MFFGFRDNIMFIMHTVDDVATFQNFRIVCFVAFYKRNDHFSGWCCVVLWEWRKSYKLLMYVRGGSGGQRRWRRWRWRVDFGGDGVTRKMAKNGMNTRDYNRKFIGVCSHTTKIVKMTIKSLPSGYVPGRHVYCLTLNPAMSNNTTNCRACGPCVTLCSNASFIYFSNTLIVDRIKSALDTVCSIPHMSMPANGTTMTAPKFM